MTRAVPRWRGRALGEESLEPGHRLLTALYANLAGLARAGREGAAELHWYEKAVANADRNPGIKERAVSRSLLGLGSALVERSRFAEAVPILERFLATEDAWLAPSAYRASARFALARALVATGGDRARSLALARQARSLYVGAGPEVHTELVALDDWLAKQ